MAFSETPQKVISLGKQLAESLGENSDTFSRWMAHYIAELISTAESAEYEEKDDAQHRCFDTILTLWKHRSELRGEGRPFKDFDALLTTLERLDPKPQRPFYWDAPVPVADIDDESSMNFMLAIRETDAAARSLITEFVKMAVQECTSDATRSYLENWPKDDAESNELSVMIRLHGMADEEEKSPVEKAIAEMTQRLECLERFTTISQVIRGVIEDRLAQLQTKA